MKLVNTNVYKFVEFIKGKKLICFGAGQHLYNFIERYPEVELEKKIYRICDNSPQKVGNNYVYKDISIPIIGIKDLLQLKDIVIAISCVDIYSIYEQLEAYTELQNIFCLVTPYIRSETDALLEPNRFYPKEYRLTKQPLIPKKIHYCWFGKNAIPEQNKKWMESWKKFCPDYEIIEWNESNYDITKNKYMHEAYQAKKWGFVPDYARLDIIYEHGGIYLDTDVELIKNMDDLLYQSAFAGIDASKLVSLGLGFGAQKGNSLIYYLREMYNDKHFINEDGSYNMIAAPALQRKHFANLGYIENGEYQIINNMTIYSEKVLSPKCSITGRIFPTEHTYSIHHYDASWVTDETKQSIIKVRELFNRAVQI